MSCCLENYYYIFFSACILETTDDILAKYRKQPAATPNPLPDLPNQNKVLPDRQEEPEQDTIVVYDPNNLESCKAFLDTKKKLRLVLSTADFHVSIKLL